MGLLHPSNLLSLLFPHGSEASSRPHSEDLASWSQATQEGSRQVGAPWGMAVVPSWDCFHQCVS